MKRVFLYAYDRQNLGDDLFVHTITRRYQNVRFYMWSDRRNRKTFASLPNLKVIDCDSHFVRFLQKLRPSLVVRYKSWLEKRCDAVVYIGGSIFYEYLHGEGIPAWWSYMSETHPLYVMGANFGPYQTETYREQMGAIFAKMRDVCFRDRYSTNLFPKVTTVRYAPDLLFSYPVPKVPQKPGQLFVSVVDCAGKAEGDHSLATFEDSYISNMATLLRSYLTAGWHVVFASFCEAEGDLKAIREICKVLDVSETSGQVDILAYDGSNSEQLLTELAASEYVIASRFHGAILALVAGVPVFPVIYSNKTAQVLEDISFPGKWADLRDAEQISFEYSLQNRKIAYDTAGLKFASQKHFAVLDERLKNS